MSSMPFIDLMEHLDQLRAPARAVPFQVQVFQAGPLKEHAVFDLIPEQCQPRDSLQFATTFAR